MRRTTLILGLIAASISSLFAQAPANCGDIMLQAFYWDSYKGGKYGDTKWTTLKGQADEIAATFSMIWLPPSAKQEGGEGVGYHPWTYCNQNSSWGTKTQLKDLLATLNDKGCKPIADIVVNHKAGCSSATDLCEEDFTPHGKFPGDWSMVCKNDEYPGGGNYDTGDNWDGARDLDHTNSKTRDMIKAYLKWLKDLGYKGWRYDVVKGFSGNYVGEYNDAAAASFSVGEYWDGDYSKLTNWVNATGKKSTIFDFCLKYSGFNEGLAAGNCGALAGFGGGSGLIGNETYKRYAVTFVDNHDTFERGNDSEYRGNIEQANAYILAMPGIPCVFWPHWVKHKAAIKKMAAARKACGITNTSSASCTGSRSLFKGEIKGSKGTLYCFIGSGWTKPANTVWSYEGNGWAYYTTVDVKTDPVIPVTKTDITVNFKAPASWKACHIWAWDSNDNNLTNAGEWPGTTAMTKNADGTYSYTVKNVPGTLNFLFNNGVKEGEQTDDRSTSTSSCWTAGSKNPNNENKYDLTQNTTSCNIGGSDNPQPNPGGSITLKVKASSLPWGNTCYVHAWDGGNGETAVNYTGPWPGKAMTLGNDGYYTYTFEQDMVYAIFNSGSATGAKQTDNIQDITTNTCYEISSDTHIDMWKNNVYDAIETDCPTTGIDDIYATNVAIYPNPTSGKAIIASDKEVKYVSISNLSGWTVAASTSNEIDLSGLASAMYLVNIEFNDGSMAVSKIIKK